MGRLPVLALAALLLGACGNDSSDLTPEQSGERMYREGILPSGEPIRALVAGDVPIAGTQFSCESCHGRSGMGASEGAFVVPPIGAQFLFAPSPQPVRPAYNNHSLARVLREGITPSGRELMVELMPRYALSDDDVEALAAYLETLSAGNSPGVDDDVIRVATVVVEGADPARRDAAYAVLAQFAADINRETRNDSERWDRGFTPESKLPTVFREWVIERWELSGPPDSWSAQLERYYEKTPVFAMLSGVGTTSWAPVGEFCERRKLLCLYPSTDLPHVATDEFYTVYYSRGLLLEADLVAAHLASHPAGQVVQVWCDTALAPAVEALRERLQKSVANVQDLSFDCSAAAPLDELAQRLGNDGAAVLWLRPEQLDGASLPAGRIYASSTLLDGAPGTALANAPGTVLVAHPFRLPDAIDPAMRRFEVWAKSRGIEITHRRTQAEAFYASLVFKNVVKHMGRYFVREYALDMIDHAEGMAAYLPLYPRPSFGPGQRYINKGGYILPVVNGEPASGEATWIIP